MNPRSVLAGSLTLNLVLAAGMVFTLSQNKDHKLETPQNSLKPAPAVQVTNRTESHPPSENAKQARQFNWQSVESEDYRKYIANLRSIGCPEETIRDIIVADVNKLFDSRKDKLKSTRKKYEYWKASSMMAAMSDEEGLKQKQELNREKRELLKELLGSAPPEKPDATALMNPLETMMDFLPSSKQAEVLETMQRYQARLMKTISNGAPDAEDQKKMVAIQKEMEADIAKIMTPQEYEDYQLRMSQTSMMMRMQLAVFDPSEQEFKDIFKLRKSFEDQYPILGMAGLDKDERAKMESAQKELNEKVKSLLGNDRYSEYERGQDFNYQAMAKTAERFNLPKDSAVKVYDMKKIAEEQANKVRFDGGMSQAQKDAALRAIRNETERSVREVFGAQAFESYQKQQGNWIEWLAPKPPTPTPVGQ